MYNNKKHFSSRKVQCTNCSLSYYVSISMYIRFFYIYIIGTYNIFFFFNVQKIKCTYFMFLSRVILLLIYYETVFCTYIVNS